MDYDSNLHEPLAKRRRIRTWSQRTLGEIKPGSIRGSIFTLTSTAIGAGCISLPLAVSYVGLLGGLFLINFTGFLAWMGLNILVDASTKNFIYNMSELIQ